MVWLFKCAGTFAACDGSGAGWFKIDQKGLTAPPLSSTNWGTNDVMKTLKWTSTIPAKLANGNYLVRHELLALHQTNSPQFYPECAQIVVGGGGGQSPSGSFLTAIPSYATASDPGVLVGSIFHRIDLWIFANIFILALRSTFMMQREQPTHPQDQQSGVDLTFRLIFEDIHYLLLPFTSGCRGSI